MNIFFPPAAGAFLAASLFLSGCAAVSPPGQSGGAAPSGLNANRFVVAGRVSDADGLPVPHLPVRVSSSIRPVHTDPRVDRGKLKVLAKEETSSDGSYRLVIRILPGRNRYYLNLYDSERFDLVRFARPDRVDITGRVRRGGSLLYNFRLRFHGSWGKVQETLKAYPRNSPKARIIRKYGIAEEIRKEKEGDATEVWWYYSRGKSFGFQGDKLAEENSFMPVLK
ncbi:MAG: hypothetical protein V3U53_00655 [bacterium]